MDACNLEGYKPPAEFGEDTKDPLIDIDVTDSTELWLIQLPLNQPYDFDGQKVTLDIEHNGNLGTLENSSGKTYNVVDSAKEPNATVFLASPSGSKIVGKVTRRVSLVHYPEPDEFENPKSSMKQMYLRSVSSMATSSLHFSTPTHSSKRKNTLSAAGHATSTHSSRHKSFSSHSSRDKSGFSGSGEAARSSKKQRISRSNIKGN